MFVLGATGESPESDPTPAIARFVNVEPSALLNAPPSLALLMTLATTSSAVISPFRMFTLAALAMLCAPVSAVPISPDVMLLRKSDDKAPATFSAVPSASASAPSVPETAGNTASGDWPLDPSGVLTYVLYACPPTDWATPATANAAVSPTTSPTTARRFTQCMLLAFISSLLPWILVPNELGWFCPLTTRAPRHCRRSSTSGPCPRDPRSASASHHCGCSVACRDRCRRLRIARSQRRDPDCGAPSCTHPAEAGRARPLRDTRPPDAHRRIRWHTRAG